MSTFQLKPFKLEIFNFQEVEVPMPLKPRKRCSFAQHEEIQIPMPWGHLAGKWYGSQNIKPLVGLHGWQDNAGTFDTLAPYLPPDLPFLAIDIPGHGLSSWLPEGTLYHSIDLLILIRLVMEECKWDKISLLGHSLSSTSAFVFAGLFPDKVDLIIGLDSLTPFISPPAKIIHQTVERLEHSLKIAKYLRDKSEPPVYEWDQLVQRFHEGVRKSINLDACKFILERNTKRSQRDPNKYYFARDNRIKNWFFHSFPQSIYVQLAERIKCPFLFIKSSQSGYFSDKKLYEEALDILKQKPTFQYSEVDGTHHVHLNEPKKIASIVNPFISKWKLGKF
uniref:AB hydrolase-1 domain-containing protein n=1 Tax=Glossina austeni TaxID=7395 RepID=A0A1A9VYH5_GLOAU